MDIVDNRFKTITQTVRLHFEAELLGNLFIHFICVCHSERRDQQQMCTGPHHLYAASCLACISNEIIYAYMRVSISKVFVMIHSWEAPIRGLYCYHKKYQNNRW